MNIFLNWTRNLGNSLMGTNFENGLPIASSGL